MKEKLFISPLEKQHKITQKEKTNVNKRLSLKINTIMKINEDPYRLM